MACLFVCNTLQDAVVRARSIGGSWYLYRAPSRLFELHDQEIHDRAYLLITSSEVADDRR